MSKIAITPMNAELIENAYNDIKGLVMPDSIDSIVGKDIDIVSDGIAIGRVYFSRNKYGIRAFVDINQMSMILEPFDVSGGKFELRFSTLDSSLSIDIEN